MNQPGSRSRTRRAILCASGAGVTAVVVATVVCGAAYLDLTRRHVALLDACSRAGAAARAQLALARNLIDAGPSAVPGFADVEQSCRVAEHATRVLCPAEPGDLVVLREAHDRLGAAVERVALDPGRRPAGSPSALLDLEPRLRQAANGVRRELDLVAARLDAYRAASHRFPASLLVALVSPDVAPPPRTVLPTRPTGGG